MRAGWFNQRQGSLTGYDCPVCRNRGRTAELDGDGRLRLRPCRCMALREAREALRRSGLPEDILNTCTFDRWQTPERWQRSALDKAREYADRALKEPGFRSWFVMAGRPGCGKTRLCSTVFRALLEGGLRGRYLSWRDFTRRAKAAVNSVGDYDALVEEARKVPLLYIDDLWKGGPTPADMNLTFQILNARYGAARGLTLLSTEFSLEAILRGDEAIGSRIRERAGEYYLDCARAKNWRLEDRGT